MRLIIIYYTADVNLNKRETAVASKYRTFGGVGGYVGEAPRILVFGRNDGCRSGVCESTDCGRWTNGTDDS